MSRQRLIRITAFVAALHIVLFLALGCSRKKADVDEKRAVDLFKKKVISDQERDTAIAAAGSSRANVEADEAGVKQAELNLGYTKITAPIDGVAGFANNQVGDLVGPSTGPLTTVSQIDPIKAVVTAGEGPFTDFVSRHPDATERNAYIKSLDFDLILGNGELYQHKGKFYALDRSLDQKTGPLPPTRWFQKRTSKRSPKKCPSFSSGGPLSQSLSRF